ncbi:unnamed protein product [Cuscuta campestris]|uniref:GATA-type domain-containing protein n=1 Tax=Cuscuta campestris TaxID=132261 RepID=A0A484M2A5_9ASTE|nr:unnamed protein product [Cuscuta campestris]
MGCKANLGGEREYNNYYKPAADYYEEAAAAYDNYYDDQNVYSSAVDCTLSLGTPSTRLGGNGNERPPPDAAAESRRVKPSGGRGGASGSSDPLATRRCANCDTTSTPLWRNGPRGPKSLCNACGIRFKKEEKRAAAAAEAANNGGRESMMMRESWPGAAHHSQMPYDNYASPAAYALETDTPGFQSQSGEEEDNTSSDPVFEADSGLHIDALGNTPPNPIYNSTLALIDEVIKDDAQPHILHKEDRGKQIVPIQGLEDNQHPYTILYPPLPRSRLSPFANEFIPTMPNSFAALFNQGDATETLEPLTSEDPLANLDGRNMALSNNAIEDMPHERDEPILYTHSDGEDRAFIDYKLKPLQIDISRCSKTPLFLGRVFKGRKTFSPSQVVTRSKARLLTEGRKKNPVGFLEETDDTENSFTNDIIQAFKQCCPVKKEAASKIPKQPLTRSQKKKAKKKVKLAKDIMQAFPELSGCSLDLPDFCSCCKQFGHTNCKEGIRSSRWTRRDATKTNVNAQGISQTRASKPLQQDTKFEQQLTTDPKEAFSDVDMVINLDTHQATDPRVALPIVTPAQLDISTSPHVTGLRQYPSDFVDGLKQTKEADLEHTQEQSIEESMDAMAAQVHPSPSMVLASLPAVLGVHSSPLISPCHTSIERWLWGKSSQCIDFFLPATVRQYAPMSSPIAHSDFMQVKVPIQAFTQFDMNNVPGLKLEGAVDDSHVLVHVPLSSFAQFQREEVPGAVPVALTRTGAPMSL